MGSCANQAETVPAEGSLDAVSEFLPYPLDKEQLVSHPEDVEDEHISWETIRLTEALRVPLSKLHIRMAIVELIQATDHTHISIQEILTQRPDLADQFPGILKEDHVWTHMGADHEPVINVPNLASLDARALPIVSPGLEVPDDPNRGIDDFIFSWIYNKEETYQTIAIGEAQALSMANPLFVVSPHPTAEALEAASSSMVSPPSSGEDLGSQSSYSNKTSMVDEYQTNEFSVHRHFEGSGNSEFYLAGFLVDPDGNDDRVLKDGNGNWTHWKELKSVTPSRIYESQNSGWLFGDDIRISDEVADVSERDQYYLFFNTYERDWSKSYKRLLRATVYGEIFDLGGKRRYLNECYTFDQASYFDGTTNNYSFRLPLHTLYDTGPVSFTNDRSHIEFKWVD